MSVLEQSIIALRAAGCSVDSQLNCYRVTFPNFTRLPLVVKVALGNRGYKGGRKTYSRSHFQFLCMRTWLELGK